MRSQWHSYAIRLCRTAVLAASVIACRAVSAQQLAPDTLPSVIVLPATDLYLAPIADPREPRFHQSIVRIKGGSVASRVWLADHGETIGLVRWQRPSGNAVQAGVLVAKFAQFDLNTESNDLVNADYMIGLPFSIRVGDLTGRISVYHISSHLGDEYLLAAERERVNVSFEAIDVRVSREWGAWRAYGGGEAMLRRSPASLNAAAAHGGLEVRGLRYALGLGRESRVYPVAAIDASAPGSRDGGARVSAKAGVELRGSYNGAAHGRSASLLWESFSGASQFGQFYREKISYHGIAVQFTI